MTCLSQFDVMVCPRACKSFAVAVNELFEVWESSPGDIIVMSSLSVIIHFGADSTEFRKLRETLCLDWCQHGATWWLNSWSLKYPSSSVEEPFFLCSFLWICVTNPDTFSITTGEYNCVTVAWLKKRLKEREWVAGCTQGRQCRQSEQMKKGSNDVI